MIKKIFFGVIILSSFVACKSKSAFNYSQEIVKKERSLAADIETTENKVMTFMNNEQYDSFAAAGARMEKLVDSKLIEIKEKPAPDAKEGAAFKDAAVKYFSYLKSLYTAYKDIGNAPGAEAREKEMDKLRSLVNQKTSVLMSMQTAQKKFADANGFKLEDKP